MGSPAWIMSKGEHTHPLLCLNTKLMASFSCEKTWNNVAHYKGSTAITIKHLPLFFDEKRYDPKENKWSKVASMNTRRLGVAVAVLGGYLYAVGGSDGQMPLNTGRLDRAFNRVFPTHGYWLIRILLCSSWRSCFGLFVSAVERYDPRQNKWTLVAPMSTRRKHLGCAVYNNWIYAVGGRDDATELSSAERYNPHTNTWSSIVAMSSRRSGVSSLSTEP